MWTGTYPPRRGLLRLAWLAIHCLLPLDSSGIVCCPLPDSAREGWGQRKRSSGRGDTRDRKAASGSEQGNQPSLPPSLAQCSRYGADPTPSPPSLKPPPPTSTVHAARRPTTQTVPQDWPACPSVCLVCLSGRRRPRPPSSPPPFRSHRRSVHETRNDESRQTQPPTHMGGTTTTDAAGLG